MVAIVDQRPAAVIECYAAPNVEQKRQRKNNAFGGGAGAEGKYKNARPRLQIICAPIGSVHAQRGHASRTV